MSDYDQHLILHHLDDPLRILHWTVDEASALILPVFLGLGLETPLLGIVVAGLSFYGLKQVKKRFGISALRHALYWYFPLNKRKLAHTPPSHVREYVS